MGTVAEEEKEVDPDEEARQERIKMMPGLEQCYNLMDFEAVARRVMKKTAWAYYSSGADDEIVRIYSELYISIAWLDLLMSVCYRRCEKTTPPITKSGSVPASSSTSKKSTSLPPCSAQK
jgi:hypothetical protein